jgi:hypothetical protein
MSSVLLVCGRASSSHPNAGDAIVPPRGRTASRWVAVGAVTAAYYGGRCASVSDAAGMRAINDALGFTPEPGWSRWVKAVASGGGARDPDVIRAGGEPTVAR